MSSNKYHIVDEKSESNRLRTLDALNILDTAPEPFYDKITRSVAIKFNAPIALVSLVDKERLFFKSAYGSDTTEVNRANTFCTAAIVQSGILVVEDACADKRFCQCPLVIDKPDAKFYAGASIALSSGIKIGTVCFVYQETYFDFSDSDRLFLQDMADLAAQYIELRLNKEHLDPMNLLPMSSIAVGTINDIVYIKKQSVAALTIELFGSARLSELLIAFGEQSLFELLQLEKKLISSFLPKNISHMFSLGIDRFLCIVGGISQDEAIDIEIELKNALSKVIQQQDMPIINLSKIGLAYSEATDVKPAALIRMAVAAMENARKDSAHYSVYNKGSTEEVGRKLKIIHDFPAAFEKNELSIHYQPKINLQDNRVIGSEALIRWRHEELGLISPTEFIPIIEETDFIFLLSDWLIERVLIDLEDWKASGYEFQISINMSARDFQQPGWIDKLKSNQKLITNAKNIQVELTETAAVSSIDHISKIIDQLNEIGIETHIDDFGTGHSTLTYLSKLNVAAIKLDQQFVMPMAQSDKDNIIVKHTCELAKALGFKLIAEGVETEGIKELLTQLDVDYAQGYLFAKPMQLSDFNRWLDEWPSNKI